MAVPCHTAGMALLERQDALTALRAALDRARRGSGSLALVTGEAGIGKTALVTQVVDLCGPDVRVLTGSCDALTTPRALGPLRDIAAVAGGELRDLFDADAEKMPLFEAALRLLRDEGMTALVLIEDVHFADDATVDLLGFLSRRLATMSTLLVVTYRDDEVGPTHPLQVFLGMTASVGAERVELEPLSPAAVLELAREHGIDDGAALHRITGGNPFFVTEIVAAGGLGLPRTVRDAVLGRAGRLPAAARRALDAAAVVPTRVELWLLDALAEADSGAIDDCVRGGLLTVDGDALRFRHELARVSIEAAMPPARRRDLHRHALVTLSAPPSGRADPARLAHHAVAAGDPDEIVTYSWAAGHAAYEVCANREAVVHYEHAARYADRLPTAERAELLELVWKTCALTDRTAVAVEALEAAVSEWRGLGDDRRACLALAKLSGSLGVIGRELDARAAVDAAVDGLERLSPGPELAYAYGSKASRLMLARENDEAVRWGRRGMALARSLGEQYIAVNVMVTTGTAMIMTDGEQYEDGLAMVREAISLAEASADYRSAALGMSQIGSGCGELRKYETAVPALVEGAAFCELNQVGDTGSYIGGWLARCRLDQGQWPDAERLAVAALANPRTTVITRFMALTVLGRLHARRGQPGAWELLDEALELARSTLHLQRLWPVAAARAEAGWLAGTISPHTELLDEVFELAQHHRHRWAIGELGFWRWRARRANGVPPGSAEPYALSIADRPSDAAARWRVLRCPYEEADALSDSTDDDDLRRALAILRPLGAEPLAARVAGRLRELGATVPRGPIAATLTNPLGLTDRELEVLRLVTDGRSNPEIAGALVISRKTTAHHVSRILAKLGVRTRGEASAAAHRLGLLHRADDARDR